MGFVLGNKRLVPDLIGGASGADHTDPVEDEEGPPEDEEQ
jgi:hypothetical protein